MQASQNGSLARADVKRFWEGESLSLSAMLNSLDGRESWVLDRDGQMVDLELNEMGDIASFLTPAILDSLELSDWSNLLSLLSFSRAMRLQRIFSDTKNEWMLDFSSFIESQREHPDANINHARLRLLSQFMFLGAVFKPARMDMITDALYEVLEDD
jgi:hypothetical protein